MPRPVIHVWLVFAQSIISTRFAPSCGAILCSGHARTPPQKNGRAGPAHPPRSGGGQRGRPTTQLGAKCYTTWSQTGREVGVWGSEPRKYISIGFRCPGRSYQYGWYSSNLSSLQDLLQVVEPFCVAATRGPPPEKTVGPLGLPPSKRRRDGTANYGAQSGDTELCLYFVYFDGPADHTRTTGVHLVVEPFFCVAATRGTPL